MLCYEHEVTAISVVLCAWSLAGGSVLESIDIVRWSLGGEQAWPV